MKGNLMGAKIDFKKMESRIGRMHLAQRLGIQVDHVTKVFGQGLNTFHIENVFWLHYLIKIGLKCLFLYKRGQRNIADIQIVHHEVPITDLPKAFDGYTILQLSDLHIDTHPSIPKAIIHALSKVEYDICVMTGDYRFSTHGSYDDAMGELSRVRKHIQKPIYGILGNHDFIEMLADFEDMNVPILLNESVRLEKQGSSIYLVGIDDPHFYLVDNIEKATEDLPARASSILLSHSPEMYKKAAYCGFDLMLSGHTHGGQLCLPGGIPVLVNAKCPRKYCAGPWRYKELIGYTSRGTGSSGLDVRYNCPPEITLHHLRCK